MSGNILLQYQFGSDGKPRAHWPSRSLFVALHILSNAQIGLNVSLFLYNTISVLSTRNRM